MPDQELYTRAENYLNNAKLLAKNHELSSHRAIIEIAKLLVMIDTKEQNNNNRPCRP